MLKPSLVVCSYRNVANVMSSAAVDETTAGKVLVRRSSL